jgi:hypothetical protein
LILLILLDPVLL